MKIKDKVLARLNNSSGELVSGGELARELGVTRNSIWKAINQLKKEGYDVTSHSNQGYLLNGMVDIINEEKILPKLPNGAQIIILDSATSSNDVLKELAQKGEAHGSLVVVKSQTNGRGRMGRSFISKSEDGLYFSFLLRPSMLATEALNITVICAVALAQAIEQTSGANAQIKWVNDIYINEKKCAGILTEAQLNFECGTLDYCIVGIGVNVLTPKEGFDKEISEIATAIFENSAPCGYKTKLLAKFFSCFYKYYNSIESKEFMLEYKNRSNLIGKDVDVYVGDKITHGTVCDIDENARLVVKAEDGLHAFSSGEARVRKSGKRL